MAEISFVTTCKGRLAHLRQSLPLMLAQSPDCEVVVVDYDCPDGTAAWVAAHFPQVTVVEIKGEAGFHRARALNRGARAARAPWLMFIDADILLAPGFAACVKPLLGPGRYVRPAPLMPDTWGTFLVSRNDFFAQGGYDEVMHGWGGEDDDLYYRLGTFGQCSPATFPGNMVSALPHDDAARTRFMDESDRWISQRTNAFYLHIKYDLMLLAGGRPPEAPVLQAIYEEARRTVKQAAAEGAQRFHLAVRMPTRTRVPIRMARLHRELVYEMELLPEGMPTPVG